MSWSRVPRLVHPLSVASHADRPLSLPRVQHSVAAFSVASNAAPTTVAVTFDTEDFDAGFNVAPGASVAVPAKGFYLANVLVTPASGVAHSVTVNGYRVIDTSSTWTSNGGGIGPVHMAAAATFAVGINQSSGGAVNFAVVLTIVQVSVA
jgi:hypothetical protein